MKVPFSILLTILLWSYSIGQIKVNLTKVSADSVVVEFPKEMKIELGKEYNFEYKTNIKLSDSIKESFNNEFVYDGMKFKKSFDHYEYGLSVTSKRKNIKKNTYMLGSSMFYVSGTEKWKIKVDGKYISRYVSSDVFTNSKIEIEVQSDNYNLSKAKFTDPVIIFWNENQKSFRKFDFDGSKITIDLNNFKDFMNDYNKSEKFHALVVLLPQTSVDDKKLFSDEQKRRCYMFRFVK